MTSLFDTSKHNTAKTTKNKNLKKKQQIHTKLAPQDMFTGACVHEYIISLTHLSILHALQDLRGLLPNSFPITKLNFENPPNRGKTDAEFSASTRGG